ncbi:hypothetical protein L1O03_10615 [Corynebacterium uropygiale]|uniref:Uncharacterized protein n=1 Tax=Corynebacterium uropygiale TaxID=1775911 RepID=A0A9X1QR57_9CORY|nr:hypothetical protein [Corynebacterium uropygiale]MCF4007616.1 hypothetical protein [Corynebacterium uropygiale]
MNLSTIRLASSGIHTAWTSFNDYRRRKTAEAYDALADATGDIDLEALKDRGSSLLDDSRKEAGRVTQAARIRLSKALDAASEQGKELAEQGKDLVAQADKSSKKLTKKARKKANKKLGKKDKKRCWLTWLIVLAVSAIAGVLAWVFFGRKEQPGTTPPRVEEYGSDEDTSSTLVYSTSTPSEGSTEDQEQEIDSEEFLADLDEQLQQHQETTGRHALIEDPEEDDQPKN